MSKTLFMQKPPGFRPGDGFCPYFFKRGLSQYLDRHRGQQAGRLTLGSQAQPQRWHSILRILSSGILIFPLQKSFVFGVIGRAEIYPARSIYSQADLCLFSAFAENFSTRQVIPIFSMSVQPLKIFFYIFLLWTHLSFPPVIHRLHYHNVNVKDFFR